MNRILVTGVGGAAGIAAVKYLKKLGNYVVGVNCLENSAGFQLADKWSIVPYASSEDYIEKLLEVCMENKVELLIPTVDEELIICSKNKEKFNKNGIKIIVSSVETLQNCLDKYRFYLELNKNNISVAKTWKLNNEFNANEIEYPILAKPIIGRGGRGIKILNNKEEVEKLKKQQSNYILQEYVLGTEYSIDTLSGIDGKAIVAVPRKRLEVKGGVCWRGCTDYNKSIIDESIKAVESLNILGPACLQLILTKDGQIKIFEINPRVGGTISLSINAGVNIFKLMLKIINNEEISQEELQFEKKFIARYFEDTFFDM